MKFANEILEDEPYASVPQSRPRASTYVALYTVYVTYGFGAHSVSLSKLAVMTSGLSGY